MATTLDKESVREAYNTIRDDSSEANWAVFKYEGNRIVMSAIGVDYAEFLSLFRGMYIYNTFNSTTHAPINIILCKFANK